MNHFYFFDSNQTYKLVDFSLPIFGRRKKLSNWTLSWCNYLSSRNVWRRSCLNAHKHQQTKKKIESKELVWTFRKTFQAHEYWKKVKFQKIHCFFAPTMKTLAAIRVEKEANFCVFWCLIAGCYPTNKTLKRVFKCWHFSEIKIYGDFDFADEFDFEFLRDWKNLKSCLWRFFSYERLRKIFFKGI